MFLATSTYSILRGQWTDPYGDAKDSDEPVHTRIPGSVQEIRSVPTLGSEGLARQITFLVGRLPERTDVRHGDRLRDERSGAVYMVDEIGKFKSPIMSSGVRLSLRLVT